LTIKFTLDTEQANTLLSCVFPVSISVGQVMPALQNKFG
jgi:hypothetical protein